MNSALLAPTGIREHFAASCVIYRRLALTGRAMLLLRAAKMLGDIAFADISASRGLWKSLFQLPARQNR